MNFGFDCDCDCGKCSWCCLKQVYAWGTGTTSADTTNEMRRDAPLQGTKDPTIDRQSPWIQVATTTRGSWAIAADGSLWGWGEANAIIGDGSSLARRYPVFIDAGPWVKVFAFRVETQQFGSLHSRCYAIKTDGSLWAWGQGLAPWALSDANSLPRLFRARLSTSIAGAVITSGGSYTTTPDVSVVQEAGDNSFIKTPAVVTAIMRYGVQTLAIVDRGDNVPFRSGQKVIVSSPDGAEVVQADIRVITRHPVASVQITDGGRGYRSPPLVQFQGGLPTTTATATAEISGGSVVAVHVSDAGAGYSQLPSVRFTGGSPCRPASATASLGPGFVHLIDRVTGGSYAQPPTSVGLAEGNARLSFTTTGAVVGINIIEPGDGYTSFRGSQNIQADRAILEFSHGSAAGRCTLVEAGIDSIQIPPGGRLSVAPPQSDDITGTVLAGTNLGDGFGDNVSAELVDGDDRRSVSQSRDENDIVRFSISQNMTGWKNRPYLRVDQSGTSKTRTQTHYVPGFPVTAGPCRPDSDPQVAARKYTWSGFDRASFNAAAGAAVRAASSSSPASTVKISHGFAYALPTGLGDGITQDADVGFLLAQTVPITETLELVGVPSTRTLLSPGWLGPNSLIQDLDLNSANGYGCGGRARVLVGDSGEMSPVVISPGHGYTEEPNILELFGFAAYFPRLVDEGPGWTDVACAGAASGGSEAPVIGIKEGLLYHWTGLIRTPSRVGKKLIITVNPKDKYARGHVAGSAVNLFGTTDAFIFGLVVGMPQASGGVPAVPGRITGRYKKPEWQQAVFPSSGEGSGGISYFDNPSDSDFFGEYEGQTAMAMASVGHGYLSLPSISTSEFADFTAEGELSGPDECIGVSGAGGLWALGSDGVLWELGHPSIFRAPPPVVKFTVHRNTSRTEFAGFRNARPGSGGLVSKVSGSNDVTFEEFQQQYAAEIVAYGSGYKGPPYGSGYTGFAAALVAVSTATRDPFPAGTDINEEGELLCPEDRFRSGGYTFQERTTNYTYGDRVSTVSHRTEYGLRSWAGQIITPSEVQLDVPDYTATGVRHEVPSLSFISGAGSGASYAIKEARNFRHGGTALSPEAVRGLSWVWIASGQYLSSVENLFHGKLEDGTIMRAFRPSGRDGNAGFYPCPVLPPDTRQGGDGGLIVTEANELYTAGNPHTHPKSAFGSIELTIAATGEGYTEPATAKFSSQPAGVAVAETEIDGKVVAIGVTNPGGGWSSPPDVVLSGNAKGEVIWGGPVESVSVTAGGSGYAVPPAVRFSVPGIPPESVVASIENGSVTSVSIAQGGGRFRQTPQVFFDPRPHLGSIDVSSGGSNYSSAPTVLVAGGGGSGAQAYSEINGSVDAATLVLTSSGNGYQSAPVVVFEGGGGSGASATCVINAQGLVESISLGSGGSNYTSPPTIRLIAVGGGSGAAASCGIKGPVARVIVTSIGSGYESAPRVFFQGGGGDGAAATAQMETAGSGAAATARIDGRVLAVRVTDEGSEYQSSPSVSFAGGQNFRASGQELLDSDFMPRAQARISGTLTAVSVTIGGNGYVQATNNYRIAEIGMISGGSGYSTRPDVLITGGGGPNISGFAVINGSVDAATLVLTSPGSGYQTAPLVRFDTNFSGGGAAATCTINDQGSIQSISLVSGGSNYATPPTIRFIANGGGSGAAASCTIKGPVGSISVSSFGESYQRTPEVRIQGGGGSGAEAMARMEPVETGVRHDHDGNTMRPLLKFTGPRGQNSFFGSQLAEVSSSNPPPGGPVYSVSTFSPSVGWAARPVVAFAKSWTIDCRTSLRIAGLDAKSGKTPEGNVMLSILAIPDGSVLLGAAVSSEVNFSVSAHPYGARVQGVLLGSGGTIVRTRLVRSDLENIPFDSPPEVVFSCETGTGASFQVPTDNEGYVPEGGVFFGETAESPGVNYGPLARCFCRGGTRRVVPPQATAVVSNGIVVAVNVESHGSGYSVPPTVVLSGGGGSGASGTAFLTEGVGARRGVFEVGVCSGGSGYQSPPRVDFVFNEPSIPAVAATPRAVELTDISLEGVELVSINGSERIEPLHLNSERAFTFPGQHVSGNSTLNMVDYWVFYEDGFLSGVSMPPGFLSVITTPSGGLGLGGSATTPIGVNGVALFDEVPAGATVQIDGECKTTASVTIIRPKWTHAAGALNSNFIAIREEQD